MKTKSAKEKLTREFEFMRDFEKWAGDFYRQISASPKITEKRIGAIFDDIASDEYHHSEIIQKIINIVKNNL